MWQNLLDALVTDQASDMRAMWDELAGSGRKQWQELALLGLEGVSPEVRSRVLTLIDRPS